MRDLEEPTVSVHGEPWKWHDLADSVAYCRELTWRRERWAPRPARSCDGSSTPDPGQRFTSAKARAVPNDRDHGHCEICGWTLAVSEDPELAIGYTDGRSWFCTECHAQFVAPSVDRLPRPLPSTRGAAGRATARCTHPASAPSPPPLPLDLMAGENLYIGSNGHVVALDPATGHERWRTRLGTGLFSATGHQDVCVLEHDGRVFAGSYGHLFCLDAASGRVLWHNELKGLGHNDVTLAIAGKAIQFVSSHTRSHSP